MNDGALIEVLQSFTPNRSGEWSDLLADAVGLLLGLIVCWIQVGNQLFSTADLRALKRQRH